MSFKQFLREYNSTPYKVYVDLDQTLVDWDAGITARTGGKRVVGYIHPEIKKKLFTKEDVLVEDHAFWAKLPWKKDAQALWDNIRNFKPYVLTAYDEADHESQAGKLAWCKANLKLPPERIIMVAHAKDKIAYAGENCILIDDRKDTIAAWNAAGGIGIWFHDAWQAIKDFFKVVKELM